jgi:hypothetical protein
LPQPILTGAGAVPSWAYRQKVRSPNPHNFAAWAVVNSSGKIVGVLLSMGHPLSTFAQNALHFVGIE